MSIGNLKDRLRVQANIETIKNAVTKYGVHLCKLPPKLHQATIGKAYLEGEVVDLYYVCAVSKFAEVLAGETLASVANKQSLADLAKYVADAINTAYDVDCVPEMNTIDIKLELQKLRIVYLPAPSLLAVISLTGAPLDAVPAPSATAPQVVNTDGKKEVTIKITV